MTIKPVLWKHFQKQDGTCAIKIYISRNGQVKYKSTDLSVAPEDWDDRKGVVKKSHALSTQYNGKIQKYRLEIERRLLEGESLDEILNGDKKSKESLLTFARKYIEEVEMGLHDIRMSTCKNYRYCLDRLEKYARHNGSEDLLFEDIDLDFYFDFSAYLTQYHRCNKPGIAKHIKNLKVFMNKAAERGLHNNEKHKNPAFKIHKSRSSNKIWLNEEEVAKLEALDLSTQPALERERDRWLLSYYLLMRYSDSVIVNRDYIFEQNGSRFLRYKSVKTGNEVILPVKPKAWEIMQKYNFRFDGDTNQEANRKLKMIGAMAGLIQETSEGDRKGPKFTFLCTHTARRSAATQMYLQNVSLKVIAELGGWKQMETLKLYLRASGIDVAMMARDLEFFK